MTYTDTDGFVYNKTLLSNQEEQEEQDQLEKEIKLTDPLHVEEKD